jgi:hypothetical protein
MFFTVKLGNYSRWINVGKKSFLVSLPEPTRVSFIEQGGKRRAFNLWFPHNTEAEAEFDFTEEFILAAWRDAGKKKHQIVM